VPQATATFRTFLVVSIAAYLLFGLPVMALLVGLRFLSVNTAAFMVIALGLPGIPATAGFSWLLGRSGPPEGPPIALMAACAVPAQLYLLFGGGVVGGTLFGPIGGSIAALAMFLLGMILGKALAGVFWRRLRHPPEAKPAA
jgi:hypothetical protein